MLLNNRAAVKGASAKEITLIDSDTAVTREAA